MENINESPENNSDQIINLRLLKNLKRGYIAD